MSGGKSATADEVAKAVAINEVARLRSLKMTLLLLAGMSLLAIIPAGHMPGFQSGDLPVGYQPPEPPRTVKRAPKPAKSR